MKQIIYLLTLATVFSACSHTPPNDEAENTARIIEQAYEMSLIGCQMQFQPMPEFSIYAGQCKDEGVDFSNRIQSSICITSKFRSNNLSEFKKYKFLNQIEDIANSVSNNADVTSKEYEEAKQKIDDIYAQNDAVNFKKYPYQFRKCINEAFLKFKAPFMASPAAAEEYAIKTEEVAINLQNGKITEIEADLEKRKAWANFAQKNEQAALLKQQNRLIQSQVDASNAQAAAARAMAIQNVFTPPAASSRPTTTNCNRIGSSLNCTTY